MEKSQMRPSFDFFGSAFCLLLGRRKPGPFLTVTLHSAALKVLKLQCAFMVGPLILVLNYFNCASKV